MPILRSRDTDPHRNPAWRAALAHQYLNPGGGNSSRRQLPNDLDNTVRDLVNFYTYGPCSEPERFLFVRRCNIEDFDMGVGTLIEAMVVAGFPVGEIAALLGIPMSHVSAYIMVYCDYTEISTEVLPSLIMSPSHNAAVRLPQFLLMAAYWHGCEGLMFALTPHIAPTDVERETLRRMLNHPTALSLPSRCPDVPMTVARSKSPGHT